MTLGESIILRVSKALETCGIPFLLSGSFASNYYGIPRSTRDADFVLQAEHGVEPEFVKQLGEDFHLDGQLTFETNTGTLRQVLRHKTKAFVVELFLLSQDAHDQSRFQRRRAVHLHDQQIWLPSPEDVVVTKLRWARGKDKDDVRDVMAVQRDKLEWGYIEQWCRRHGTLYLMEEIRHSLPAR